MILACLRGLKVLRVFKVHKVLKAFKALKEVKGLKVRAPTRIGTKFLTAIGAAPVQMPIPQVTEALANSTYAGHIMPYGPTKFVNGQNQGGAPVNTQIQGADIKVIFPADFADAKPVFPRPA